MLRLPLLERKRILRKVLAARGEAETIRLSEDIEGDGREIFDKACELGTEGIISKRRGSLYRSGESREWLKTKCSETGC